MKKYEVGVILGLVFFLVMCSKTKNPIRNSVEDPPGFRFESTQSSCTGGLGQSTGGDMKVDTVIFSAHGDTIVVLHQDALYHCCARIVVSVKKTEIGFDLFESDTGAPCDCQCHFDITTTICDLSSGSYFLRVFNVHGNVIGSGVIDIPARYPRFESFQSECKTGYYKADREASPEDSVLAWFDADTIWVMHKNAFENCCSFILSEVERTPQGFNVFEHDTAIYLCHCLCYFDLVTTIYDVSPGVYLIRVFDLKGECVGEVVVEIPSV